MNTCWARCLLRTSQITIASGLLIASGYCLCCSGTKSATQPTASLAQSLEAQNAFAPIRHRWALSAAHDRALLDPLLRDFITRFTQDPLARVAEIYLAWIALDRGDYAYARAVGQRYTQDPTGATRDLAQLIEGATLCKQGSPETALDLLTPLVGKLIDPPAQALLHEQIVSASVKAHRWFEAVAYMDGWLRSADPQERVMVRAEIDDLLATFPIDALETALRSMQASQGGYGDDIRQAVASRLATIAVERSDARLARAVLDTGGSATLASDAGQALARLATSGGSAPRVVDATVGMLIPTADPIVRARAAEAVAGLLESFGPSHTTTAADGGGLAPTDAPALVSREDTNDAGSMLRALADISHAGASIVVAGFDSKSSAAAMKFAEANSLPMLLVMPPEGGLGDARFSFVIGEDESNLVGTAELPALAASKKFARIGGPAQGSELHAPCYAVAAQAGDPRFPLAMWKSRGVSTVVVAGPPGCARDVLSDLSTSKVPLDVILGLEATGVEIPSGLTRSITSVRAGIAGAGVSSPKHSAWIAAHGSAPSWFASLGRDAGLLAAAAVQSLPKGTTVDPARVMKLRSSVQAELARVQADLWTTEARGFGGGRTMPRQIASASVR